jgi:hypothetical protein
MSEQLKRPVNKRALRKAVEAALREDLPMPWFIALGTAYPRESSTEASVAFKVGFRAAMYYLRYQREWRR